MTDKDQKENKLRLNIVNKKDDVNVASANPVGYWNKKIPSYKDDYHDSFNSLFGNVVFRQLTCSIQAMMIAITFNNYSIAALVLCFIFLSFIQQYIYSSCWYLISIQKRIDTKYNSILFCIITIILNMILPFGSSTAAMTQYTVFGMIGTKYGVFCGGCFHSIFTILCFISKSLNFIFNNSNYYHSRKKRLEREENYQMCKIILNFVLNTKLCEYYYKVGKILENQTDTTIDNYNIADEFVDLQSYCLNYLDVATNCALLSDDHFTKYDKYYKNNTASNNDNVKNNKLHAQQDSSTGHTEIMDQKENDHDRAERTSRISSATSPRGLYEDDKDEDKNKNENVDIQNKKKDILADFGYPKNSIEYYWFKYQWWFYSLSLLKWLIYLIIVIIYDIRNEIDSSLAQCICLYVFLVIVLFIWYFVYFELLYYHCYLGIHCKILTNVIEFISRIGKEYTGRIGKCSIESSKWIEIVFENEKLIDCLIAKLKQINSDELVEMLDENKNGITIPKDIAQIIVLYYQEDAVELLSDYFKTSQFTAKQATVTVKRF